MNDAALLDLLGTLDSAGYDFVSPTPLTHARVLANGGAARAGPLRRLFGWSCAVDQDELPAGIVAVMAAAGILEHSADGIRSTLRVSRVDDLFFHSAFPTEAGDSVFLGPDSIRFARLIKSEIGVRQPGATIVDIGTGAGVGALAAARLWPDVRVIGTDINPAALRLARINARYAGCPIDFFETRELASVPGRIDIALANPPYIIDDGKRQYRDGGDMLGTRVAFDMAAAALARLAPGGQLILYTGSPIVDGHDALRAALKDLCVEAKASLRYYEIDPDVFGEELARPGYASVERIALVAAVAETDGFSSGIDATNRV